MKKHNIKTLVFYIASAEIIGALSALLTGSFSSFFETYTKPPLLPPGWVFPVMWVILYALMGYSAYLVNIADAHPDNKKVSLSVYWIQLAFNFSWSIVFFRFEWLWGGFGIICALLLLIILMTALFYKVDKKAALINVPYIIWVAFASYLNFATASLN